MSLDNYVEITEPNWVLTWCKTFDAFLGQFGYSGRGNHTSHIFGNIANGGWGPQLHHEGRAITIQERTAALKPYQERIELYISLLREFPEYREAEFKEEGGYFPDIPDSGAKSSAEHYIQESAKRLRMLKS